MRRRELWQRKIAERWYQEIADNLAVALVRLGGDLRPDSPKPLFKPVTHRQARRIDVFARIHRVKQPSQFFLSLFAGAADRPGGNETLSRGRVSSTAVAHFPRSWRTFAYVAGWTAHFMLLSCA